MEITPASKTQQLESMDTDLRNSLWSLLTIFYWKKYVPTYDYVKDATLEPLIRSLWLNFFKTPIDSIPSVLSGCRTSIRKYFFDAKWYQVYDFIEFVAHNGPPSSKVEFINECNKFLERENAAYRFIDNQLTAITSKVEIESIEKAIEESTPFYGVKKHLQTSLIHLSNKENPDYRNSIKESISAVESLAKQISGKKGATLGEIVKELEKDGKLHKALKNAFSSLYGYTSDAKGIRHGLLDEDTLNKSDAQFMLICCSAFINYVIDSIK